MRAIAHATFSTIVFVLFSIVLTQPTQAATVVGTIEGQHGASGGSATYSIPIVVPPGRNGMQPSLSLNYSSGSGNGLVGVGWSLGGFSAITRCSANFAQDSFTDGVEFDGEDRYCLNGQRLLLHSGTYGAASSEYRVELDATTRVKAYLQQGSGPMYWVVTTKDGHRHWYGANGDSRVEAQGRTDVLQWRLSYTRDTFDNQIDYAYLKDTADGETYPDSITYTRHASQNAGLDRKVEFVYAGRTDDIISYTYGSMSSIKNKRLSKIQTFVGTQKAREYRLTYDYSPTGRSRVTEIEECAYQQGKPEECLPATDFDWHTGPSGYGVQSTLPGGNGGPTMYDHKRFAQADINGDGHNDLIRMGGTTYNATNGQVEVYFGGDTGFTYGTFSMTAEGWGPATNSPTIDYNNDGRTDLTVARTNGSGQLTVHAISYEVNGSSLIPRVFDTGVPVDGNNPVYGFETPSGGFFPTMTYVVLDINGDGMHDIVTRNQVGSSSFQFHTYIRTSTNFVKVGTPIAATSSSAMFPMDLDGDGKTDMVVEETGPQTSVGRAKTFRTLYSNGSGFYEKPSGLPGSSTWKVYYESYQYTSYDPAASPTFIDVNGDGLLDVLMPYSQYSGNFSTGHLKLYINTGDGFVNSGQIVPRPTTPMHREDLAPYMVTFDYNNDGNTDLLFPGAKTISAPGTCIPLPGSPGGGGTIPFSLDGPDGKEIELGKRPKQPGAPGLDPSITSNLNVDCFAGAKNDHDGYDWHVYLSDGERLDLTAVDANISATLRGLTIVDLDADSLPDIYADKPPTSSEINPTTGVFPLPRPVHYYVNQQPLTDLVSRVTNGLGKKVEFEYGPLTDGNIYTLNRNTDEAPVRYQSADNMNPGFPVMPFTSTMRVVKEMRVSDGLGGSGMNRTLLSYESARYDLQGRGFLGFDTETRRERSRDTVTAPERQITRTETKLRQDYPFIGWPSSTYTWLNSQSGTGHYVTSTLVDHEQKPGTSQTKFQQVCNDASPAQCSTISHTYKLSDFPYVRRTREFYREPNPNAYGDAYQWINFTLTWHDYDAYGNLLLEIKQIEDNYYLAHNKRKITTTHQYAAPDISTWWINKRTRTTVAAQTDQLRAPFREDNVLTTRTTDFQYHSNRKLYQVTEEPGDSQLEAKTAFTYDAWGNQLTKTVSSPVAGERGISSRTSSTDFTSDKYFAENLTNPSGHTSYVWTDQATGLPGIATDPNGVTVETEYDNFGRPVVTTSDGSPPANTAYQAADVSCNGAAAYMVTVTQSGRPTDRTCFDSFRRVVKTRTQGFAPGQWIYTETKYSPRGLVLSESEPFTGSAPTHVTSFQNHDDQGRVGRKVSPNGMVTDYIHEGRRTKVVVQGGARTLTMYRTYNSSGQLVETQDAMGGVTRYRYDGFGNPVLIEGPAGDQITAVYNTVGHKESMDDPDRGQWFFVYDVLGQLKTQTDAKGQRTRFEYDPIGRQTKSFEKIGSSAEYQVGTWVYDGPGGIPAAPSIGKLHSVTGAPGEYNGFEETYSYDSNGRPTTTTTKLLIGTQLTSFPMTIGYDSLGRQDLLTYPTGFAVKTVYNSQGYASEDRNAANNLLLRRVGSMNERNQVLSQEFGWNNKLNNDRSYFADTGQLSTTCVYASGTCTSSGIQHLIYNYDAFQNMSSRASMYGGIEEVFDSYDDLHRLTASHLQHYAGGTGSLPAAKSYSYDSRGNFLDKSDFGTYLYPTHYIGTHADSSPDPDAGPNAVTRLQKHGGGTVVYSYDENGNVTSGDGRTASYTVANKPKTISKGGASDTFWYNPNQSRWKRTSVDGITVQTYYVNDAYEYVIEGTGSSQTIRRKHYVGDYLVHIERTGAETGSKDRFLLPDHLGSVDTIANVDGLLVERKGFDVFGALRSGDWSFSWNGNFASTTRGFTGHEHLTGTDLIHMNGRAYDPTLGRFLSVDPFIQFPEHSQSLNGYSYILNNPLSATDPTGYLVDSKGLIENRVQSRVRRSGMLPKDTAPDTSVYGGALNNSSVVQQSSLSFLKDQLAAAREDESKGGSSRISALGSTVANTAFDSGSEQSVPVGTMSRSEYDEIMGTQNFRNYAAELNRGGAEAADAAAALLEAVNPADPVNFAGGGVAKVTLASLTVMLKTGKVAGRTMESLRQGEKLSDSQTKALRKQGRTIWAKQTGSRASSAGLDVHHRIPLEWSHMFPDSYPNRLSNLRGVPRRVHEDITTDWAKFKRTTRNVTPEKIAKFAESIDQKYGNHMRTVSDP